MDISRYCCGNLKEKNEIKYEIKDSIFVWNLFFFINWFEWKIFFLIFIKKITLAFEAAVENSPADTKEFQSEKIFNGPKNVFFFADYQTDAAN